MKKRIFVIDDEHDFTHMLRLCLETMGYYHVGEENEPAEAVRSARLFDPDLILLDVMMPHTDGSEIAADLRRDPVLRDVPVLFMTALVTGEDAPAGVVQSAGQTFLPKSLGMERLMECIEQAIDARREALAAMPLAG
jgi:two-component system, OmpR family, response regulator